MINLAANMAIHTFNINKISKNIKVKTRYERFNFTG